MVQVRTARSYEFGDFQLDAQERRLLRNGELVPLHGKAFEMLMVLVSRRGQLLTKDELFKLVWPDQVVEESNLTVNMSAIRRALGEQAIRPHYITTVSGRGYRFMGDVRESPHADSELTIERESFTRVTVEQEEVSGTSRVAGIAPMGAQLDPNRELPAIARTTTIALDPESRDEDLRRRKRLQIFLISGLLGLLLLTVGVSASLYLRNRRLDRQRAGAPLAPPQSTMHRFSTNGGVPFRVAISPDGKSLVYLQRIKGKDSLWLGQIETNSSVQINQPSNTRYGHLVFAPDGGSIYFSVLNDTHPQWTLLRMPTVGGAVTELIQDVDSPVAISPDSRQLAFIRGDQKTKQTSVIIADADGQRERTLAMRAAPERFSREGLSWSPGAPRSSRNHAEIRRNAWAGVDVRWAPALHRFRR